MDTLIAASEAPGGDGDGIGEQGPAAAPSVATKESTSVNNMLFAAAPAAPQPSEALILSSPGPAGHDHPPASAYTPLPPQQGPELATAQDRFEHAANQENAAFPIPIQLAQRLDVLPTSSAQPLGTQNTHTGTAGGDSSPPDSNATNATEGGATSEGVNQAEMVEMKQLVSRITERKELPAFVQTSALISNSCGYCGTRSTSGCWRRGWEIGQGKYINLCNKCGLRHKAGKLQSVPGPSPTQKRGGSAVAAAAVNPSPGRIISRTNPVLQHHSSIAAAVLSAAEREAAAAAAAAAAGLPPSSAAVLAHMMQQEQRRGQRGRPAGSSGFAADLFNSSSPELLLPGLPSLQGPGSSSRATGFVSSSLASIREGLGLGIKAEDQQGMEVNGVGAGGRMPSGSSSMGGAAAAAAALGAEDLSPEALLVSAARAAAGLGPDRGPDSLNMFVRPTGLQPDVLSGLAGPAAGGLEGLRDFAAAAASRRGLNSSSLGGSGQYARDSAAVAAAIAAAEAAAAAAGSVGGYDEDLAAAAAGGGGGGGVDGGEGGLGVGIGAFNGITPDLAAYLGGVLAGEPAPKRRRTKKAAVPGSGAAGNNKNNVSGGSGGSSQLAAAGAGGGRARAVPGSGAAAGQQQQQGGLHRDDSLAAGAAADALLALNRSSDSASPSNSPTNQPPPGAVPCVPHRRIDHLDDAALERAAAAAARSAAAAACAAVDAAAGEAGWAPEQRRGGTAALEAIIGAAGGVGSGAAAGAVGSGVGVKRSRSSSGGGVGGGGGGAAAAVSGRGAGRGAEHAGRQLPGRQLASPGLHERAVPTPLASHVRHWTPAQLHAWLHATSCAEAVRVFRDQDIDGLALTGLFKVAGGDAWRLHELLRDELGVQHVGLRLRLVESILVLFGGDTGL